MILAWVSDWRLGNWLRGCGLTGASFLHLDCRSRLILVPRKVWGNTMPKFQRNGCLHCEDQNMPLQFFMYVPGVLVVISV
jgi:hypothetical protein